MKIIVDAMGGDKAPLEAVKGAVEAAKDFNVDIILTGVKSQIEAELEKYSYDKNRITIRHCEQVITGDDNPVESFKTKKDSSMLVGLNMLSQKEGDAFLSAGNTGALVSGATLIVKRIKGIRRTALATTIPTRSKFMLLLDVGATAECTPQFLEQFAVMGSIYMNKLHNIENPRVGLVNIGTEDEKGTALTIESHMLLKNSPINYIGNLEAREIPLDGADVAVCDGFTGNVILKLTEGLGITFADLIKQVFMKNALTKISALFVKKGLKDFKKKLDYTEYGGAPLLGLNGTVIKAHGSSNAKAFYHAIGQAVKFTDNNIIDMIKDYISEN